MLWVFLIPILKQESASLVTSKMTVPLVTPESGLVQEGIPMTPTRVETLLLHVPTMETNTSKPWVTSWCSKKKTDIATLETGRRFADRKTEKYKLETKMMPKD